MSDRIQIELSLDGGRHFGRPLVVWADEHKIEFGPGRLYLVSEPEQLPARKPWVPERWQPWASRARVRHQ